MYFIRLVVLCADNLVNLIALLWVVVLVHIDPSFLLVIREDFNQTHIRFQGVNVGWMVKCRIWVPMVYTAMCLVQFTTISNLLVS